jgi:hypothetical protein
VENFDTRENDGKSGMAEPKRVALRDRPHSGRIGFDSENALYNPVAERKPIEV